jgi:hypothetical protein
MSTFIKSDSPNMENTKYGHGEWQFIISRKKELYPKAAATPMNNLTTASY